MGILPATNENLRWFIESAYHPLYQIKYIFPIFSVTFRLQRSYEAQEEMIFFRLWLIDKHDRLS